MIKGTASMIRCHNISIKSIKPRFMPILLALSIAIGLFGLRTAPARAYNRYCSAINSGYFFSAIWNCGGTITSPNDDDYVYIGPGYSIDLQGSSATVGHLYNQGTFYFSGGLLRVIEGSFTNVGSVPNSGTLQFLHYYVVSGNMSVYGNLPNITVIAEMSNSSDTFNASSLIAYSLTIRNCRSASISNTNINPGQLYIENSSNVSVDGGTYVGGINVNSGSSISLRNSISNGYGIWADGYVDASSATMYFQGSSGFINGSNSNTYALDFANLTINSGTSFQAGNSNATRIGVSGTLNNYGVYNAAPNGTLVAGALYNSGTFYGNSLASELLQVSNWLDNRGAFYAPSYGTMYVSGNFNNQGSFIPNNGTLSLNGAYDAAITGNSTSYYNLTVAKSSGAVVSLSTPFAVGNQLDLQTGKLDIGSQAPSANSTTLRNGATLRIGGTNGWPSGLANVTVNSGATVEYNGAAQTIPARAGNAAYQHLALSGTGAKTLAADTAINGDLTVNSVALNTSSRTITLTGSLNVTNTGVLNPGVGLFVFNGAGSISTTNPITFNNLTINVGAALTPPTGTLAVNGDWTNKGTFNAPTGTVAFVGANQVISGSNAFYNLSKNTSTAAVLTFAANQTQTVKGALTLQGASGSARLGLRSTTSGVQWQIDPRGQSILNFLDIRDSNNVNALAINAATRGIDAGNNTHWNFVPTAVSSISVLTAGTYILGQPLTFSVAWNNAVTISGTPRLTLTVGATTRYATYYAGSGTTSTTFRYTPQAGDLAATGSFSITGIDLNGGEIKDLADNPPNLTLKNIASLALLGVDAAAPAVNSVSAPAAATYGPGQALDFNVTWNEPVVVSGTPQLTLTVGTQTRNAVYQGGNGTTIHTFRYTVQNGDAAPSGIVINGLTLNGAMITDAPGNSAALTVHNVADASGVLVDGVSAQITQVDLPTDGTYAIGQHLDFVVHWDEVVNVIGLPRLTLDVGGVTRYAMYAAGSGTSAALFRYTAQDGDSALSGIAVSTTIDLNNGALMDANGNAASRALGNHSTAMPAVDGVRPVVVNVNGPTDGPYGGGAHVDFIVHWSKPVTVVGTPRLNVEFEFSQVYAPYYSGAGTDTLVFRYTVHSWENGALVQVNNNIDLNGGQLTDLVGNAATRKLYHYTGEGVVIDTTPPSVVDVAVPDSGAYRAGQMLTFTVNWSEIVNVTGAPQLTINLGATPVQAAYVAGSGSTRLTFAYTVQAGDSSNNGISVSAFNLNGGEIKDPANNAATLTLANVSDASQVRVDTTAPDVTSIQRLDATPSHADSVRFRITFSEAVNGVGASNFSVTQGSGLSGASLSSLVGSGVFYTATVSGYSGAGALGLDMISNTGVSDLAGNTLNSASFTGETYAVDTVPPSVSSVSVPASGSYIPGQTLTFSVNWNEAVSANGGTPRLALTVGADTRYANYQSGGSTSAFTFAYTVQASDQARQGISIVALDANGATLRDDAGNDALLMLHNVGSTSGVILRGAYDLHVIIAGTGLGSVTRTPDQASYAPGSVVTLTAQPAVNSQFAGWSGALSGLSNPITLTIGSDKTITAALDLKGEVLVDPSFGPGTPGWGVTRFASIQAAINAAAPGDVIHVYAGMYAEVVNLNRDVTLLLDDGVAISGNLTQSAGALIAPAGALTLGGNFTQAGGTFDPNGGSIILSGNNPLIDGPLTFNSLTMAGTGTLSTTQAISVAQNLNVNSGAFTPASNSVFNNVIIGSGATLTLPAHGNIEVTGNWTNSGTVNAGTSTVIFDGAGGQTIGGAHSTPFTNVTINNSGAQPVTANPPLVVTGDLAVTAGTLQPGNGADLHNVLIGLNGTLDSTAGTINVSGDWADNGTFIPGNGVVIFDGAGSQIISGTPPPVFGNLIISSTGTVSSGTPISVSNGLTISHGVFTPAPGSSLNDVTINPGGTLMLPPHGSLYIRGTLTNHGASNARTLSIAMDGDGAGVVSVEPAGSVFAQGTLVTLTAQAGIHSSFSSWSGDATGSANPLALTMDADKAVTATFALNTHTVTVNTSGDGAGHVTVQPGGSSFKYGMVVTLTATPNTGSHFGGWSGDASGSSTSVTLTVDSDKAVTAAFALNTQTLTIHTAGEGTGTVNAQPGGNYKYGDVVTLTAASGAGSHLLAWSGDATGSANPLTLTLDGDKVVTATFALDMHTVTVNSTGDGLGNVTIEPATGPYKYGSVVTLTATAGAHSTFGGWSGAASGSSNPLTLTIDGDKHVTAAFILNSYTLDVQHSGQGSVQVEPAGTSIKYGAVVTLTATPDTGWAFTGWSGAAIGNANPLTLTVNGNTSVTATYTIMTYTLGSNVVGQGLVDMQPDLRVPPLYEYGTLITMTAVPDIGWHFVGWSGDITSSANPLTFNMSANTFLTATFALDVHTLTIHQSGDGAGNVSVEPDGASFTYGTVVTLTASPVTGSHFDGWTGDANGARNSITVTIDSNKAVTAAFTLDTHTLAVYTSGEGMGAVDVEPGGAAFKYGTVVTLTANPGIGSHFDAWSGDAGGTRNSITFTMDGDKAVTATFTLDTHSVTVNTSGDGAGSVAVEPASGPYKYGTVVTLTATASAHSSFSGWSGDAHGNLNPITLTMDSDKVVTAAFALDTHTVRVSTGGDGTGSVSVEPSGSSFKYGMVVTLTATGNAGAHFAGWNGAVSGVANPITLTMDSDKALTATFSLYSYTLDVRTAGDGAGSVSAEPPGFSYKYGTVVTLTATPNLSSTFSGWSGACIGTGACVVTLLDNRVVTATFASIVADVAVSQAGVRALGAVTFTVVIVNHGPASADGTVFSDTIPSVLSNVAWTCRGANGAVCPAGANMLSLQPGINLYRIHDALPNLPAGSVVTYTITGQVGLLEWLFSNQAEVISPAGVTDPLSTNNTSAVTTDYYRMLLPLIYNNAHP
jgi:uncharacterized repeat protein (TIGR01451 family)